MKYSHLKSTWSHEFHPIQIMTKSSFVPRDETEIEVISKYDRRNPRRIVLYIKPYGETTGDIKKYLFFESV
jgi:hypothetical protein